MPRLTVAVNEANAEWLASELPRRYPQHMWATVALTPGGEPIAAQDNGACVLWRRQEDRTAWLLRAVDELPHLRWIHTDVVGVERFPLVELARRGIVLTNGAGNFARPMAEWIVWAMLTATKSATALIYASGRREWVSPSAPGELAGRRAVFLGFGSTGRAAAELLAPLEVKVVAVRRNPEASSPSAMPPTTSAWREHLSSADYLVVTLPLTRETTGIVNRRTFSLLKSGAWLINFSRGELIDEAAICDALDSGRLGGAILDAFDVEPLPATSRLWGRENVIVLPHITASSVYTRSRCDDLFLAQIGRYAAAESLMNVVDLAAGY